jgi:hypothetical protein
MPSACDSKENVNSHCREQDERMATVNPYS